MKFNPDDALRAMILANAAYKPWSECEDIAGSLGFTRFKSFENNNTEAYVAANDDEVVYAFRGTTSVWDVLKDIRVIKSPLTKNQLAIDKRRVHSGFLSAFNDVADELSAQIYEWWRLDDTDKKVMGTGHSLGAGINVLFSGIKVGGLKPDVWLFGCPRVGNRHFAREYDYELGTRTYRVVNNNDAVCSRPRLGYRHVGREVYIDWRGNVRHNPGLIRKGWNQVAGRWASWRKTKLDGVGDHFATAYLSVLGGIQGK